MLPIYYRTVARRRKRASGTRALRYARVQFTNHGKRPAHGLDARIGVEQIAHAAKSESGLESRRAGHHSLIGTDERWVVDADASKEIIRPGQGLDGLKNDCLAVASNPDLRFGELESRGEPNQLRVAVLKDLRRQHQPNLASRDRLCRFPINYSTFA